MILFRQIRIHCLAGILGLVCLCQQLFAGTYSEDSIRISRILDRGDAFTRSNADSSLLLYHEALALARNLKRPHFEGMVLHNIGFAQISFGKEKEAIATLKKADKIFASLKDERNRASVRLSMGKIYGMVGDYAKSIKVYHLCRTYFEEIADSSSLSLSYHRLGGVYADLGHYQKAIEFYRQSLALNLALKFDRGISANFNNIASSFQYLEQYDSALVYLEKALVIKKATNDKIGVMRATVNIGVNLTGKNELISGEKYLFDALKMAKDLKLVQEVIDCNSNLCELHIKKGEYKKAIQYGQKALTLLSVNNFPRSRIYAYRFLSKAYAANEQHELAFSYLQKHIHLRDSLLPRDLAIKMIESEANLEAEKQKAEIDFLESRDELNQLKIQVQDRQIWWFVVLMILLFAIAIVLFSRYRLKININKQLQLLDEAKSRFFVNLSHEFRTPLTLIIGPLEKLVSGSANDAEKQQYSGILRNAKHLLQLNDELLELARIESGIVSLKPVKADVVAFLKPIAGAFEALAVHKNIQYEMQWVGDETESGFDAEKLEKVVNNLLSNAIKYTPEGGKVFFSAKANAQLEIQVVDTGSGISPQDKKRIFDRYFRLDQHVDKGFDGSGIGLSLTRELVELMGGTIELESEVGKGSQFVIKLPLLPAAHLHKVRNPIAANQQIPSDEASVESHDEENQPVMLIVDDHQEIRNFIKEQFVDHYKILEAENGQQGLEIAIAEMPDIVISDLMMPVMDGVEFCHSLKQDERTNHIPFVLLTALATIESRIEGLKTGADDYLNKPFNPQELVVRVENLVAQRRKLRVHFLAQIEAKSDLETDPAPASSPEQVFFSKVEEYVFANLTNPELSVERLAEEMAMSRVQLFRKLKAIAGQSPSEMIRKLRLRKAASILGQTDKNVADAMFEAGFDNPSYFAKVFREQYGCSPSDFRKK